MIGRKFLSALSRGQYTLTELKAATRDCDLPGPPYLGGFYPRSGDFCETGRAVLGRGHLAVLRLP